MSHASGIKVSDVLAQEFAQSSANQTRLIKVSIANESLVVSKTIPVQGSFNEDFQRIVEVLEPKIPAYVLFRLDNTSNSSKYEWLLLSFVPDNANVREKMLYASTRSSLLKDLGENRFVDSIFGTTVGEFTLDGYNRHIKSKKAAAPLTRREQELAAIKQAEAAASEIGGINSRNSLVEANGGSNPGGALTKGAPLSEEAKAALSTMKEAQNTDHNIVILTLNTQSEIVNLQKVADIQPEGLAGLIPTDHPSFTFYAFDHDHQGQQYHSILFIYTCPTTSKVRERMLYSCCTRNIVAMAEKECGLIVNKKFETNDPSDITKQVMLDELHPKVEVEKVKFSRPRGPGRR